MNKDKWLEQRRNHIGASEVAAILGADPRRGQLAIYEAKINGHSMEDTAWLAYGRDVETAIANMYEHETDRKVRDLGATAFQYHKDFPWLAATLDRVTTRDPRGPWVPLELKSVDPYGAKTSAEQWRKDPPLHYVIQLQIQMACTGSEWGSLAGLFPGYQLAWLDIERDDQLLELAYPVLADFWQHVISKNPPPVDSLPATNDVVKRLYPKESGETIVMPGDMLEVADLWESKKSQLSEIQNEIKKYDTILRAELKDASFGVLPDGTLISGKTVKRNSYTVEASEYRTLRRTRPKGF